MEIEVRNEFQSYVSQHILLLHLGNLKRLLRSNEYVEKKSSRGRLRDKYELQKYPMHRRTRIGMAEEGEGKEVAMNGQQLGNGGRQRIGKWINISFGRKRISMDFQQQ